MRLKRTPRIKPARIEMLPLIDIVFLLLVFFIYAMLSMAVHRGMNVDLPASARSVQSLDSKLSVSVTVDEGRIHLFLDREQVSPEELENRLRVWKLGRDETAEVLLFADRTVSYQQLYQVLDRISGAGVGAISLQADQKR